MITETTLIVARRKRIWVENWKPNDLYLETRSKYSFEDQAAIVATVRHASMELHPIKTGDLAVWRDGSDEIMFFRE